MLGDTARAASVMPTGTRQRQAEALWQGWLLKFEFKRREASCQSLGQREARALVYSAAARRTAAALERAPESRRLCGPHLPLFAAPGSKLERVLNHRNAQASHIP